MTRAALAGAPGLLSTDVFGTVVLAHAGDHEAAHSRFEHLMSSYFGAQDAPYAPTSSLLGLLEIGILLEDRSASRSLFEVLQPTAGLAFVTVGTLAPARLLGDAAAFLGDHAKARAYYRQALEGNRRVDGVDHAVARHVRKRLAWQRGGKAGV